MPQSTTVRSIFPVLTCTVLLLCAGCQRSATNPGAVRVDPALANLIPADTSVLVGARLDQLRATPIYEKHFSQIPLPRLDEFAKETGLDPRKDLSEVLFAAKGTQGGVLIVRGKFMPGELEAKIEKQGAARTSYKGYSLFGDDRNSVFFMNASTALAGSTPVLKSVIDNKARSAGIPADLKPQVDAVPPGSQFWAVFSGSAITLPFADNSNLGNMNQFIRSIEHGRFSADLRSGFDFQANGSCKTDGDAKQIHDTLRGLIGLGRLSTPENQPDLLRVYDAINVKQDGRMVNVAANIPPEVVDKFVATYLGSRSRR